jgi:hypothetical protein
MSRRHKGLGLGEQALDLTLGGNLLLFAQDFDQLSLEGLGFLSQGGALCVAC